MIVNKRKETNCFIRFFNRSLLISTFLVAGFLPFSANAFDILLGTGETGTFSHFTGRMLCRIINSYSGDINCKTASTPDDVDNLTNLRAGSLDIGLIDSRMLYDAINKTGNFEFLDINYDVIRVLVPLYYTPVTLVVRSDAGIDSLEELKGKRLNAGAPLSMEHLAMDTIMKTKNWSNKDFGLVQELSPSQSQDTMSFCHGTVQAMLHIGVHPDSSLQQLFKLCKARLVNIDDKDIDKLVDDHPAFSKINIAADIYPSHPQSITTIGTMGMLVASEDLDEQTVYKIMDAIYSNPKRLKSAHPALSLFAEDTARKNNAGAQPHSGAAKYFSEHGM